MKNLHIKDSYCIWSISEMKSLIRAASLTIYKSTDAEMVLRRSYLSMYVEWWLHNIGYYITLPFISFEKIEAYNKRFKDVDLEEYE